MVPAAVVWRRRCEDVPRVGQGVTFMRVGREGEVPVVWESSFNQKLMLSAVPTTRVNYKSHTGPTPLSDLLTPVQMGETRHGDRQKGETGRECCCCGVEKG